MENENLYIENNLIEYPYFKLAYEGQKYEESSEYQKWKKIMIKSIGENGKEFFCNKDKIVIFQKNENIEQGFRCPICKNLFYVCPYCRSIEVNKKCCFISFFKEIINTKIKIFIEPDDYAKENFLSNFLTMFIPLISNIIINICMFDLFYFFLYKNNIKYGDKFFETKLGYLSAIILYSFSVVISLSYIILYYEILIFLIIISLPFKLYLVKLLMGIIDPLI